MGPTAGRDVHVARDGRGCIESSSGCTVLIKILIGALLQG
jgi:hypothetical protein